MGSPESGGGDEGSDVDTTDSNASGQGGGSAISGFWGQLLSAAVKLVVSLVEDLANALQGRSIVGSISNNTLDTLTLVSSHHDHGGFKQVPPQTINARSAVGFSSETQGVLTGTQGSVTYAGPGHDYTVTFSWDNPEVGSNSASASKDDGPNASRILTASQTGSGNAGAEMKYYIFSHPDYSVKSTFRSNFQGGVLHVKSLFSSSDKTLSLRHRVSNP